MKTSVQNISLLEARFRFDAEYYQNIFIDIDNQIRKKEFKLVSEIKKSPISFGPYSLCSQIKFVEYGIPFIQSKDLIDGKIRFSNVAHIDQASHELLWKSEVLPNTLLISMAGSIGNCAVSPQNYACPMNSNQAIAKLILKEEISINYVLTFFLSYFGQMYFSRLPNGSIQDNLLLWQIDDIPIYIPSKNFQNSIDSLVNASDSSITRSISLQNNAETLLLTELGLENWQPKKQLSFVADYAEVQDANRFDADYFQPHYKELLERISEQQIKLHNFGETVQLRDKNYQPIAEKEYRYIELSDIGGNGEITGFSKELGQDLPSRARRIVRKGNVIISSIEGSIDSVALISDKEDGALCSTGFYVAHSEIYNPETLLVLLKSIVGQLQLKRGCNGTILTAISKDELKRLKLPEISEPIQEQLKQLVQQMYDDRAKSKHLLETAKRAVEIAIEEDEPAAFRFIEQETA